VTIGDYSNDFFVTRNSARVNARCSADWTDGDAGQGISYGIESAKYSDASFP
jgi:hypothetical protein